MGFGLFPGSPLSSLAGDYGLFSNPTGAWDQFRNGRTNEVNEKVAEQNLSFQRANLEYQKALQQQIFDREDSSYQRTVKDMRTAGLSPLAMTGTNGAGEAIATQPLHNDFQMQDSGIADFLVQGLQSASAVQEIKRQQLENEKLELENKYSDMTFDDRVANVVAEKILKQINAQNASDQRASNKFFGITDNMPEGVKKVQISSKLISGDNSNAPAPIKPLVDNVDDVLSKNTKDYDSSDPYDSALSKIPVLGWIFRKSRDYSRELKKNEMKKNGVQNAKKARSARH